MRNRYPGHCYYCHKWVDKQKGHFERSNGKWRVIHAECVLIQQDEKYAKAEKEMAEKDES